MIGDYRTSIFTYAFTFLARTKQTDDTLERISQVGSRSHSVRKRLSLLALALTMPFNCPPPESLRHGKGNRDHIVFLELYIYIGRSVKGYSFSIYADVCSLFRQKSRQRESSGFQRIQIPLLPRSPAASQQFSERSCPLRAWDLSSRRYRTLRLAALRITL